MAIHSITLWRLARSPNYIANVDKEFHYSEVPFIGDYHLIKIPEAPHSLINHVDYWGEGLIVTQHGRSGFSNCYNVNHTYQLVSNGPDRNWKIPNRVPVVSYTNCSTRGYIKDNSVVVVTLMGAPINKSCAADIARMINKERGKVIVYGFGRDSADITNLTVELKNKSIYHCADYKLPTEFQGLTLFDSHMAFLNLTDLKIELVNRITNAEYSDAITLTKNLCILSNDNIDRMDLVREVVESLLGSDTTTQEKLMSFAYQLWDHDYKEVVRSSFPIPFKLIFGEENVTIVNFEYQQALTLGTTLDQDNDRRAWGDGVDKTSKRVSWRFVPVWKDNGVTFKVYNVECDMYLKLAGGDSDEDRSAWGSTNSDLDRHRYYLEPYMRNDTFFFFIINYEYRQGLKLATTAGAMDDRSLWGHSGDIYNGEGRFKWLVSSWEIPKGDSRPTVM